MAHSSGGWGRNLHLLVRGFLGSCLGLGLLTQGCFAYTANDIRSEYGVALSEDKTTLEQQLLTVQQTIRSAKETALYNEVIATVSTQELEERISLLTTEADTLYSNICGGVDASLEEILSWEARYKQTVTELNNLLSVRDVYVAEPLPDVPVDLTDLQGQVAALRTSISKVGVYEDLGVRNYYPIEGQDYYITSSYGSRYDPIGERGYMFHSGIDLRAPEGTPIGAWFSGTVSSTGYSWGSGNYIWLNHGNGVYSFYCHLSEIQVVVGDNVTQGTQIALSGNTGYYSTGPHLHLALYIDGVAVDPQVLLE